MVKNKTNFFKKKSNFDCIFSYQITKDLVVYYNN